MSKYAEVMTEFSRNTARRPEIDWHAYYDRTGTFDHLYADLDVAGQETVYGLINYLGKNGVAFDRLDNDTKSQIETGIQRLVVLTAGTTISGARNFRYFSEARGDAGRLVGTAVDNADYWLGLMGTGFFAEHPYYPDRRHTFYKAPIDDEFYLSCKCGRGSGVYSVDFAIGQETGKRVLLSGEIWRTGLDTELDPATGSRAARIIRTGGTFREGKEGCDAKRAAFNDFYRRYKILPNRALAFLAMFTAHELPEIDRIRAISSEGVRDGQITHLKTSKAITFDYTKHLKDCGFNDGHSSSWLEIPNNPAGFYEAVTTSPVHQSGLRGYELYGFGAVVEAVRNLQDVRSQVPFPLTVCSDESPQELEAALKAFRCITNRPIPSADTSMV